MIYFMSFYGYHLNGILVKWNVWKSDVIQLITEYQRLFNNEGFRFENSYDFRYLIISIATNCR